jgi:hypothetical protein
VGRDHERPHEERLERGLHRRVVFDDQKPLRV